MSDATAPMESERSVTAIKRRPPLKIVAVGSGGATRTPKFIRLTSCSSVPNAHKRIIRLAVRFARRNTLFYDEDLTDLLRLVSAVSVGMKAMG